MDLETQSTTFEELFGDVSDKDQETKISNHSLATNIAELCELQSPPMSPLRPERPTLPTSQDVKQFLKEIGYTVHSSSQLEGIYFTSSEFTKYSVTFPLYSFSYFPKVSEQKMIALSNIPSKPSKELHSSPNSIKFTPLQSEPLTSPSIAPISPAISSSSPTMKVISPKEKNIKLSESNEQLSMNDDSLLNSKQNSENQPGNRFSSLNANEHLLFLELRHLIELEQQRKSNPSLNTQIPFISPHQYNIFTKLREKVLKEQEEFRLHRQNIAFENRKVYLSINPAIQVQLEHEYSRKRQKENTMNVMKTRYFLPVYAVDVRAINHSPSDPILKHKATLYEDGKVLMFDKLPSSEIPLDIDYFSPNQPSYVLPKGNLRWHKKSFPSIFEDKNIKELLDKGLHKIDIVLTSSVLSSLIDSFDTWDIPVSIATLNPSSSSNSNSPRKVVFLGKPFVKSKLTQREKTNHFYNVAFRTLSLHHPSRTKPIVFDKNKYFLKNIVKEEATLEKQTEDQSELEEDNMTYNLWEFGGLNILIRCKIHGFIRDRTSSLGFRYVGIKTKVDYLHNVEIEKTKDENFISDPEVDKQRVEEVTISETAKWWINTFIRPDAHLMLGKIDVKTSKIIDIEKKTMINILPPGCLFRPERATKIIQVLLSKLVTLEEGSYVLSHKSGEHNIVVLKGEPHPNSQDVSKYYDLASIYSGIPITDQETIPYIPLKFIGPPTQIPDTFPIRSHSNPKKGWSISSVISKPDRNYCPAFVLTGNCVDTTCDLAHKPIEQIPNLAYCVSFAYLGYCKSPQCGLKHVTFVDLKKKAHDSKKRKKKNKKKKNKSFETQNSGESFKRRKK